MKKMLVFLGILGIMVPQGLFAQMENPADKVTIIESPVPNVLTAEEKTSLSSFGWPCRARPVFYPTSLRLV